MTRKEITVCKMRYDAMELLKSGCKNCDAEKKKLSNEPFDSLFCEKCLCGALLELGYGNLREFVALLKHSYSTVDDNGNEQIMISYNNIEKLLNEMLCIKIGEGK